MTTNPWYASNARDLLEMRRQGLKPERPVNVSLMGQIPDGNITLYVRDTMPVDRLDWRMLVNLDVIIWADSGIPFDRVLGTVWTIAKARPAGLQLCFLHRDAWHLIDFGAGYHSPRLTFDHLPDVEPIEAFHAFCWHPINAGATAIGRRLLAAINKTHKPGVTL